jgi:hypothetical protein
MKSDYLRNKIGRILLASSLLVGIGVASSTAALAQDRDRDGDGDSRQNRVDRSRRDSNRAQRDRNYDRSRDSSRSRVYNQNDRYSRNNGNYGNYGNNGNYGNYGNNGNYGNYGNYGGYGNSSQVSVNQGYQDGLFTGSNDAQRGQNYNPQRSHFYRNGRSNSGGYYGSAQAYRSGFLRGYDEGYRRNAGYNGNRRSNGNYGRFPFPW